MKALKQRVALVTNLLQLLRERGGIFVEVLRLIVQRLRLLHLRLRLRLGPARLLHLRLERFVLGTELLHLLPEQLHFAGEALVALLEFADSRLEQSELLAQNLILAGEHVPCALLRHESGSHLVAARLRLGGSLLRRVGAPVRRLERTLRSPHLCHVAHHLRREARVHLLELLNLSHHLWVPLEPLPLLVRLVLQPQPLALRLAEHLRETLALCARGGELRARCLLAPRRLLARLAQLAHHRSLVRSFSLGVREGAPQPPRLLLARRQRCIALLELPAQASARVRHRRVLVREIDHLRREPAPLGCVEETPDGGPASREQSLVRERRSPPAPVVPLRRSRERLLHPASARSQPLVQRGALPRRERREQSVGLELPRPPHPRRILRVRLREQRRPRRVHVRLLELLERSHRLAVPLSAVLRRRTPRPLRLLLDQSRGAVPGEAP
mmetsp:Transcript_23970/g.77879  ORF Transcript_23970/g.77879 Transcript_23970/m.77879 type:complete len:443 (-) Transcript_23970:351-1679(-)